MTVKDSPLCSKIQEAVLRRVRAMGLPPAGRVLDAPCGSGALAVALGQLGFDTWAADVDASATSWLGERLKVADLSGPLPWPDSSFDAVLSIEGIEHLENQFFFLREVYRVLRADGVLMITTPNTVSLRSRVRFFGSGFFHRDPRPMRESSRHPLHHIGLRTMPELRYALHTSGFRLLEVGHTHIKAISYVYALLAPWMWLYTLIAFRKEKDPVQRACNREIRRAFFSLSVLFGENLMLVATKG